MSANQTILLYLGLLLLFTALGAWRQGRLDPLSAQMLFNIPAAIYSLGNVINYFWLDLSEASLYAFIRPDAYLDALRLCIPALVAFNVAYIVPPRRPRDTRRPAAVPSSQERVLARYALAAVPLAWAMLVAGMVSVGAENVFLGAYGTWAWSSAPTAFLLHIGEMILETALILLAGYCFRYRRWRSPFGAVVAALLAGYFGYFLIFGKRAMLLMVGLGVVMVRHLIGRRIRFAQAALVGVAMLFLFVLVEFGRTAPTRLPGDIIEATATRAPDLSSGEWRVWLSSVLGQGQLLGSLAVVTEIYPRVEPYRMGTTYLEAVVRILPRAVWEDWFPLGYSEIVGENWAFFYLAEAYMNFGPAGVVLVPALIGFLLRRLDDWKEGNISSLVAPVLFGILAGDMAYLARLDLGSLSKGLVYRPLFLWLFVTAARLSPARRVSRRWQGAGASPAGAVVGPGEQLQ